MKKEHTFRRDSALLQRALDCWLSGADLRNRRDRHKRFTYGDQWCDRVEDAAGVMVEESRLLTRQGKRPLTNNLIRQLVKTIVGRYRGIAAESELYDSATGSTDVRNCQCELDCRMLEEFVISGCAVQRVTAERRPSGSGVWVDNVSPADFFVCDFRDPRGFDIDFIGMVHDMTPGEVFNRFGQGSGRRCESLRNLYLGPRGALGLESETRLGAPVDGSTDFFTPRAGRCRVIEVWELRCVESSRPDGRRFIDMRWHQTWLAPDGAVLGEGYSPYRHGSHPFVVKFYPLTDGEVHSFVEDVIDQQKTINRLVMLVDAMLASSAKGALLFPVDQLPKGVSLGEVARLWARPDALIPVAGRAGSEMPRQVVGSGADAGAYQLLNLQMKLFEDVSGISDALMGRNVSAATGASLYDAQVRNATLALTDLIETFTAFTAARADKVAATLRG